MDVRVACRWIRGRVLAAAPAASTPPISRLPLPAALSASGQGGRVRSVAGQRRARRARAVGGSRQQSLRARAAGPSVQENPTAVSCRVVGRQIEAVPGRTCAWCTLMFGGSPLA